MKKLNGWILYNGSLKSPKFQEHIDWLAKSIANYGVGCVEVHNGMVPALIAGEQIALRPGLGLGLPDFAVFWDKDVRLGLQLEAMGLRLFNPASVVATCDDKSMTHIALAAQGIPMPKTVIAPLIFPGHSEHDKHFLEYVQDELKFPMVVKECFGSFGAQVYLANNADELTALHRRLIYTPHLYQQFISSSFGRDVRIQVVGEQVVASVLRVSDHDFRANVTNGGRMEPFQPPSEFTDMAVRCSRVLGADFAGVDLLFGPDGEPVLCEVNSNAHFKNLYNCTGVDVADHIARYIVKVMTHG